MLYLYHKEAGKPQLKLTGDEHRYLFKVRRHKVDDSIYLRTLEDTFLHQYRIDYLDKRSAILALEESKVLEIKAKYSLHIVWCIIDPKNIEKVLPTLNEMGVEKITFIYCKRSQKSFKLDFKRLGKILLNSSQQSGRSKIMHLEMVENLETFLRTYPQSKMLNFSENNFLSDIEVFSPIVIGCEGGFHEEEMSLFSQKNVVGFNTSLVLKSESAACAVAAALLL